MLRIMIVLVGTITLCSCTGCAGTTQEQMGPQSFDRPSVEPVGCDDPEILQAVEAAVAVARSHSFHSDASGSRNGRVVVTALWKGDPVTLTMRFYRSRGQLSLASARRESGDALLSGGGRKIELLFYGDLLAETMRRGLAIFGNPHAEP